MNQDQDLKLSDNALFAKGYPFDLWRQMRTEDPVHRTRSLVGREYWSLTRHADIVTVLSDQHLFSSQRSGCSLPTSSDYADAKKSEHARLVQAGAMIPVLDAPRHTKVRSQFIRRFSPRVLDAQEDRVRTIARGLLASVPDGQPFDFVDLVASKMPSAMIFAMMDIPRSDWDALFRFTNMHAAPEDPEFSVGTPIETRNRGVQGTISYCRTLGLERRRKPGDDLLSHIATIAIDGERFSDDEVGFMGHMFVVAGQETTRNTLSGGLYALIQRPEEFTRLRGNAELLRTAPDEFARWASPIAHLMRTATADTDLGGRKIREGDWVVSWLAAGNRDPEVFTDPERLDVGRDPNRHLSFGFGPHLCLGAYLARMQLRVMLQELLQTFDTFEIAGDPEYAASNQFCGMKHLPLIARRRRAAA